MHLSDEDEPFDRGSLHDGMPFLHRLLHEHGNDGGKPKQPLRKQERREDRRSELRLHFTLPFVQPKTRRPSALSRREYRRGLFQNDAAAAEA
jgi:hypothetical protein